MYKGITCMDMVIFIDLITDILNHFAMQVRTRSYGRQAGVRQKSELYKL